MDIFPFKSFFLKGSLIYFGELYPLIPDLTFKIGGRNGALGLSRTDLIPDSRFF